MLGRAALPDASLVAMMHKSDLGAAPSIGNKVASPVGEAIMRAAAVTELPKPRPLEIAELKSAAGYEEWRRNLEQVLHTVQLHGVVTALVRDPFAYEQLPCPAARDEAERAKTVLIAKHNDAGRAYAKERAKFNFRTYRWAEDRKRRDKEMEKTGLLGQHGRVVKRVPDLTRVEELMRTRVARARMDRQAAVRELAAYNALPPVAAPAPGVNDPVHAAYVAKGAALNAAQGTALQFLNDRIAEQRAAHDEAAHTDPVRHRRGLRWARRRQALTAENNNDLAAHRRRCAARHVANRNGRGYVRPAPSPEWGAVGRAAFVATYLRQPGFVTDEDSEPPQEVQGEDISGGEDGDPDLWHPGDSEAKIWKTMADTEREPDEDA